MSANINDSKKRKQKSFANDRLKRLRTTLNDDFVKSSSTNIPKIELSSSVKNNIQNIPQSYPERKKLVAVRKLKSNNNEIQSKISSEIDRKNSGKNYSLPKNICTSKIEKEIPTYSGSITSTKKKVASIQKDEKSESHKCSSSVNRNIEGSGLPTHKSTKITEKSSDAPKTSGLFDVKTPKKHLENLKTVNISEKRNKSTFSNFCSSKTEFKYQHVSNVQSPQVNSKSKAKGSSVASKDYNEYFGLAMNLLYNKLFSSNQNAIQTNPENEAADADSMEWEPDEAGFSPNIPEHDSMKKFDQEMYIIVDTNIFLDSLSFLQGIVNYGSNEGVKTVIYVPWMVFNELDFIKDNRSSGMQSNASKAIDFINKMLLNKEGKLIGQSIFEANKQMYVGKSPDDKIVSCCFQVKEKGLNAVLLSNDKNLRNKLIINGIPSLSCSDLLENFDDMSPHADKIEKLLDKMSKCCTVIIIDCCVEAYGSVWNQLALLDKQPWSFKMCLEIFKKYWSAVFRDKLLKQCLKSVEKMMLDLNNSGSLKNPVTFEDFAKDCLSLCFFLTDLEQHKDLIAEITKEINIMVGPKSSI